MIIATICAIGAALLIINLAHRSRDQEQQKLAPIPVENQRQLDKIYRQRSLRSRR